MALGPEPSLLRDSAIRNTLALGFVQNLAAVATLRIEGRVGNLAGNFHQLAQHRPLADNLSVGADIRRPRCFLRQFGQVGQSTGIFQVTCPLEKLRQGDHIQGLTFAARRSTAPKISR